MSANDETTGEVRPVRVLIVDDDDGDALLVEELFADSALDVTLDRARSIDEALGRLDVDCILLDLGLPDSSGLAGVERIHATGTGAALVVLTGMTSTDLGVEAVAAGAQDYLVKHEVDADLLARSVRYAVQRRLSDEQARTIYKSSVRAQETARLERALLPTPSIVDQRLSVLVGYLPGGDGLLGGDFYDVVEREDGSLACVIGDVAGHGPDEAALGATLRTAWRTLVLADVEPERILPLLEKVMLNERSRPETFTTLCQLVISADRTSADLFLAGHHAPILVSDQSRAIDPTHRGRALGIPVDSPWSAQRLELDGSWWLMLYTDGLLEATVREPVEDSPRVEDDPRRDRGGRSRIGIDGLLAAVSAEFRDGTDELVERILRTVHAVHGGRLVDDAAVLILGWPGCDAGVGQRSATLADSEDWG
ncbi:serine phosphatase RsbU, regulator of sigma subunit [Sanguibacter keddieii DSM 10542]|uniref:Serine phosphatase RsbU, regulator of sigma subunit n=1 Tax=Sanguibacter keddieii (strain ATCC 51767 / DSM 10542 / NCFB 3025 / ST-74) TaxID=446469 RepID=D1BJ18_SANKS|nr:SpoIIE family protein phosphatase [Sanguibacter keddieii]ACZ22212.1 serine phosphatase RsbU, regulator of sigma subunit [Sanguibacter keddieii DSM 10542]